MCEVGSHLGAHALTRFLNGASSPSWRAYSPSSLRFLPRSTPTARHCFPCTWFSTLCSCRWLLHSSCWGLRSSPCCADCRGPSCVELADLFFDLHSRIPFRISFLACRL